MKAEVVSRDVAKLEFERFGEAMALDFDLSGEDDESKKGFEQAKKRFIDAVMSGLLVVDDVGQPTLSLQVPVIVGGKEISALTFYEPTGATMKAIDGKAKTADVAKKQALMAAMCRTSVATIEGMSNRDNRNADAVFILFLG